MIFSKKFQSKFLISGLLLPVFLLGLSYGPQKIQAVEFSGEQNIIFASNESIDLSAYEFASLDFMFGDGIGLPITYKATVNHQTYNQLARDKNILYVEKDLELKTLQLIVTPLVTPSDPFYTSNEKEENKQWYLAKIRMSEAWLHGKGSSSTKVAIIDTGIHASHLELNDGRVAAGFDVTSGVAIPANSNSDDNGHGTAVAGIIGAITDNEIGIAGINWNVSLIPVKALDSSGSGTVSDISTAIVWASENGAHIINLSVGGPGFGNDQTLNNAIIYAYGKGSLIVAAAGNDLAENGINLDTAPGYPICADGGNNMVIGVAASDVNDKKASFSNYGINCVDITAPGRKIITTAFLPSDPSDNILIYGSGTSLAAPMVSGVAALIKSNRPNITNTELKNIILKTADNIDALNQNTCLGLSCNGFLGKGRLNALLALQPQPLLEGTLVRQQTTNDIYLITGGRKRLVTTFVFQQRGFNLADIVTEQNLQLTNFPTITPLPPLEGALIKGQTDPTVYIVHQELKRPLTFLVFQSRNYSFANVNVISEPDLAAIPLGDWYWPPDGTMVLVKGNPTVYVMHDGVKRPVTYFVFTQRQLSFNRVVTVTQDEFGHIPNAPDSYWLPPLEGTLVKSDIDATVYLIQDASKHPITYDAFIGRKLKFSNIRTLPQAEIDVIAPGAVINN